MPHPYGPVHHNNVFIIMLILTFIKIIPMHYNHVDPHNSSYLSTWEEVGLVIMAPPHGPINSCQICWQTHVLLIIIILTIGFETIIIIFTIGFLTIIIIISSIAIVILMLYLLRHIGLIVGLWELFIYPWWQPSVSYNELQWSCCVDSERLLCHYGAGLSENLKIWLPTTDAADQ